MNYIKRLSLSLILLLSVVAVYAGSIKNAQELVAFVTAINKGEDYSAFKNDKGVVCLEADIDMAKVKKFQSVKSFGGTFDGQGFALKNWKAQSGLFHEILEGGKVLNLRIDASCSMKVQNKSGEYFVGWIADINSGQIENCENHAPLVHKSNYTDKDLYIGGIVGSNRYVIYNCRNYGNITSTCVSSKFETQVLRLGGIAGGAYPKSVLCATIARCENHGKVAYAGDMPFDRVGGIIGESFKTSTKMCVNRGAVSSQSNLGEESKIGDSWVAGIAAFVKFDVICCDNFGAVSSTGCHRTNTAGIVATPHNKLVIADCTNFGKVEASNDSPAIMGGVVASIRREAHIINGVNRGHIYFAGASPRNASFIGGVVGSIYTVRGSKTSAYMRRCVNYGKVESLSGGNNYENHDNAIHTGGIIGRSAGSATAIATILDCYNKGEVKAATGRKNDFAARAFATDIRGEWFDNNYAMPCQPMADGANLYGRVTDTQGNAVVGCVVSDGKQCVTTNNDGYYAMKSDMASTRFVQISLPAEYKLPHRKSVMQIFRRIPRYQQAASANFRLERRTEATDKYTVIMIGDPQMRGLGHDGSGERYRDVVLPDIEQFKTTTSGEFFAINLGDLVYNWMAGYDDYMDISASCSYPMCHIIGNHDYDQNNILETALGTPYFEEYVSPTYYSFNIGKIHYVMVNSIVYNRADHTKRYGAGLEDEQMKWLEEDLKYVPKDHTIYICGHAQLYKKKGTSPKGSYGMYNVNYERYNNLLKQYKRVYSWSGHYHINHGFDYAGKKGFEDMGHISAIAVARCNGTLRSNLELDNDGTPNGYMVVNIDGEKLDWYYKTVGKDRSYQMRAYSPTRTGDGYVKVNIWNYTQGYWSDVEWWENGAKVANFEKFAEPDPAYLEIHSTRLTHLKGTAAKYAKPTNSDYMFRIKPTDGVRSGEIRVTDNFGVTYTEKVEW